ncbi:MAG: hypothetical protein E7384_03975 [Ruminococcaceae bacterium]|nr:hypothetical protein [Oscillospiraceae bacterium]
MFKIAGPVIVYGTVASVAYGLIYWITPLFLCAKKATLVQCRFFIS